MSRHFAQRVFEDDLGPELTARYLGMYYAWHERLALLLDEDPARWEWGKVHTVTFFSPLVPGKVMGVLTGGASGRQFDPHLKDQTDAWLSGEPRYWWFSDAAIAEHTVSELMLQP